MFARSPNLRVTSLIITVEDAVKITGQPMCRAAYQVSGIAARLPIVIPFNDEPNLDEITGPIGPRIQLVVHNDNVDTYTKFEDLEGHTVGVVSQTGGPTFIETYEDVIEVEEFRWRIRHDGPGIQAALSAVANKQINTTLIFSIMLAMYEQSGLVVLGLAPSMIIPWGYGLLWTHTRHHV